MGIAETIPITKTELSDIQETIISLINTFPELPCQVKKDGVLFEQLKPKKICMCMSTIQNPYRFKTYIDGSYVSRYRFKLVLQTMDVKDQCRIDSQGILSKIGEWLEGRTIKKSDQTSYSMGNYPEMSDGRKITNISKNSVPNLVQRLLPNIEISEASFFADYFVPTDF